MAFSCTTVSYTHLDVYKRQLPLPAAQVAVKADYTLRLASLTNIIQSNVISYHETQFYKS